MRTRLGKKSDRPIFKRIIDLIPQGVLKGSINKYKSDRHCSKYFTCDQLTGMLFGQLNKCPTSGEISIGIDRTPEFLADMELRQSPAKSAMRDGNAKRDYRVFEELYHRLCRYCQIHPSKREGYKVMEEIRGKSIRIMDATIMTVCLKLFPWAEYRTAEGGIKAHASLDE